MSRTKALKGSSETPDSRVSSTTLNAPSCRLTTAAATDPPTRRPRVGGSPAMCL